VKRTKLHLLWRDRSCPDRFLTGVSLHSHTLHSRESMSFVPRYTAGVPVLANAMRRQEARYQERCGRALDYGRAFWRPPLAAREAMDLEKSQIQELGLKPLVSLSDHDDIQAGALLSVMDSDVPISVEWTVPFGASFFHVGIHNLPAGESQSIMSELAQVTSNPTRERVREILGGMASFKETLIVWNHPAWDEARIGSIEHAQLLGQFLERFGEFIHAFELNGLRPWSENRHVMRIAAQSGHPLISGGDRHGLEPNANLNLTNASTFAEFVDEIRTDRISDVLFMPQYREPLRVRMIETMLDIVRDYPEFPADRRRWSDRVFYEQSDGAIRPLSALWNGDGPWVVKWFLHGLRAAKSQQVRNALKLALADGQEIAL
jgi:hypothetical protein